MKKTEKQIRFEELTGFSCSTPRNCPANKGTNKMKNRNIKLGCGKYFLSVTNAGVWEFLIVVTILTTLLVYVLYM